MQLDPEVAYWAEMSEALAWADIYRAAAALPGDPVGAITAGRATASRLPSLGSTSGSSTARSVSVLPGRRSNRHR